jgi:hypothetical protein
MCAFSPTFRLKRKVRLIPVLIDIQGCSSFYGVKDEEIGGPSSSYRSPRSAPRRGQPPPSRPPNKDTRARDLSQTSLGIYQAGACRTFFPRSRNPERAFGVLLYESDRLTALKTGILRNPPTRFRYAPASSFKRRVKRSAKNGKLIKLKAACEIYGQK